MLKVLHSNKGIQLIFGLVIGILFGFLLQTLAQARGSVPEGKG